MSYQEEKLKAIGRLTVMATIITVLLIVSVAYPNRARSIVESLPLWRHGSGYGIWLAVLATMAPICWAVNLALMLTSPEQEVRFVRWSQRWRKTPIEFENIEFDTLDPNYRKAAWRYFLDRPRS